MGWLSALFATRDPRAAPLPHRAAPLPSDVAPAPDSSSIGSRQVAAERQSINPWRLIFGGVLIVFGMVALIYFSFRLRSVITLGLVALLLAVGLQGPVARLRRVGVPRPIGLLLLYVAAIVLLVMIFWLLLPPVFRDLRELAVRTPDYLREAEDLLGRFGIDLNLPGVAELEQRIVTEVSGDVGGYLGRVASILSFTLSLFGGVLNAFFVLILSIFIVMEGPGFRAHLLSLLPPDGEARWSAITRRIAVKIQGWMLGTLFLGLVIGGVTTLFFVVVGMPYPFLLGFIAGLGELIPMIGPIIAAVPSVGIAAFQGWGFFILVLSFAILVQQCENYLLVPRIMGSTVELPGLVVLVAFLIGTELMGVTGGILAMPVAAVVQVLWLDWIVPAIRKGRGAAPVDVRVDLEATT